MTLFATASFAIAFRLMQEPGWRLWFLLTFCCILGFFTVPVMAYPFVTLIFWMCLCIFTGTTRMVSILSLVMFCVVVVLGTLLLYTPMLRAGGLDQILRNSTLAHRSAKELIAAIPGMLVGNSAFIRADVPLIIQCVFGGGLGTVLLYRRNMASLRFLLLATVCGPFIVVLPFRNWPFARIVIYMIPIFAMAACSGIVVAIRYVSSRWRLAAPNPFVTAAAGLVAFLVLASGLLTSRDGYMAPEVPNADRMAAYIAENIRPGDAILASMGTDAPLEYYLNSLRVPFHHLITDESWTFNAYLNRSKGLPNRDCWTRLFVIECRTMGQPSFDQMLRYMGPLGPVSTKIIWQGELVKVYSVSKLPARIRGVTDGMNWVLNGDFEASNVCWWDKGTAVVEETSVHAGARSLQIGSHTGGAWQTIALRRSSKYTFTAWGRVTQDGEVGWLGISLSGPDRPDHKLQCEIHTTGWQKCTFNFLTPFDLDQATVFAWKGDGEGDFEADGFDVEAVQN
jgi:hypothetical protein